MAPSDSSYIRGILHFLVPLSGKIEVHNPHKLQSNVLNRYFRHSKFASFQRQLNYFGFRKLAGKGKMAPCSYVNDATTKDLGSLLLIKVRLVCSYFQRRIRSFQHCGVPKNIGLHACGSSILLVHLQRKVGNEPTPNKSTKKRDRNDSEAVQTPTATNPALTSIFYPSGSIKPAIVLAGAGSQSRVSSQPPNKSQQELARVAVGKGIRHRFSLGGSVKPAPLPTRPMNPSTAVPPQELPNNEASRTNFSAGVQEGLSALESNYKSSLGGHGGGSYLAQGSDNAGVQSSPASYFPGSLSHNDSLVDLAMIPLLEDSTEQSDSLPFTFIDFPWQDPNSSAS